MAGFGREVVTIDGKTVRRSFDRKREQPALHVASAPVSFADIAPWDRFAMASGQGLVLGHSRKLAGTRAFAAAFAFRRRCVDGKSNEITAVPGLLDQLALGNSIMGQRQEAQFLIEDEPGMRQYLPSFHAEAYPAARRRASAETGIRIDRFPKDNPWAMDAALTFVPPEPPPRGRRAMRKG